MENIIHNKVDDELNIKLNHNPYIPMTEAEILTKLENSRKHASNGQYRDADNMISDMRSKYGL